MSSFANLFGTSAKTDNAVDKLFSNSADGPISRDELVNKKRTIINIPETKRKKAKQQKQEDKEEKESEESEDVNGEDNDEEEEQEEDDDDDDEVEEETTIVRKSKKNDDNEDLESQYFDKLLTENKQQEEERNDKEKEGDESEESETKEEKTEKTEKTEKPKKAKAATTIDLKEAELEKADRTIFVGNVPSEIITSKAIERSFKKLFKHYGQIESIRYRSISFDENLPRKVAFSKKNLHKSRDSANAYIVYKEKPASLAAVELNASVFEDHHLRVDHVAHPAPKDNKKTIFVGNLDFEEKEESLWKYFNSKLDNDVQFVRIVRDSKTNLGKGFALVQFKDTLSVNKALLLHDKPLEVESADGKKKGRKLRISRAKSTAKPSLMSPNHFDNQKKKYASNRSSAQQKLTDSQRTKLGRAQSVLGKADRSTVGKAKKNTIFEGQRATKGENIKGIKGLKGSKKGKVKKPRIRDRSTKFKEERKSMNKV